MIIGAGIGALGSAAMVKSKFTGALMGGALGGLCGDGGLFGGAGAGATGATTGIQLTQPLIQEGLATSLAPTVVGGSGAAGITGLGTKALGGAGVTGLGSLGGGGAAITGLNNMGVESLSLLDPSRLAYNTPLSFGEKLSNMGSDMFSYAKENPTSLLSGANTISDMSANAEAQNQQKLNNAVSMGAQPISKKDFDPSSAIAAAPSYGLSRDEVSAGKVAQIASQARLNDEDVRRIRQFYPSLIG
jgi:hypothetical protein